MFECTDLTLTNNTCLLVWPERVREGPWSSRAVQQESPRLQGKRPAPPQQPPALWASPGRWEGLAGTPQLLNTGKYQLLLPDFTSAKLNTPQPSPLTGEKPKLPLLWRGGSNGDGGAPWAEDLSLAPSVTVLSVGFFVF